MFSKHNSFRVSHQEGVTSIEYALLAALIAVAIIGVLSGTGAANGSAWIDWTTKILDAII